MKFAKTRRPEKVLSHEEVKKILDDYHLPIVREGVATTADEAIRISNTIGYPIVLKILSPDISHKTEAHGVKLNLRSGREVEEACSDLLTKLRTYQSGAKAEGFLIQEMVEDGIETIVGLHQDPTFGPVLMFGIGGVWVELLRDISFRVLPIHRLDAIDMVEEIKGSHLFKGFRGKPPLDTDSLHEILLSVSRLGSDLPEIQEMDLNPVFVREHGTLIADARIIVGL
jgi:acetyltransferase